MYINKMHVLTMNLYKVETPMENNRQYYFIIFPKNDSLRGNSYQLWTNSNVASQNHFESGVTHLSQMPQ